VCVVGASVDDAETNARFRDQLQLRFPLLSDPDGEASRALGILSDRGTAKRTTFLLDRSGVVRRLWESVSVPGHTDDVLAVVREAAL
jgi:peroxiredoxin Q/BCP